MAAMTNILEAIVNISTNRAFSLVNRSTGRNRANNAGEALEQFVKDAFANTFITVDQSEKNKIHSNLFSWLGNQNHPPDIMIKHGDAIEVKKVQNQNSDLALNSSYPKSTIRSDSNMITKECKSCEKWLEKDLIYCVGHTTDTSIKSLWMVYGNIYAAKHEVYQIIKQKITDGIKEIPNIEIAETNELGRVNKVDPLGITNLRIRGMWQIQNPRKVFSYLHKTSCDFEVVAIVPKIKYDSFPLASKNKIEHKSNNNIKISDVQVKNPNNPAKLIAAKMIVYRA